MIVLSATILPKENALNSIRSVQSSIERNNISSSITEVINEKKAGGKPFLLGASKLGKYSDPLTSFVNYYIGSVASNHNGNFYFTYYINVYGYGLQELVIRFDTYNNQHPKTVRIYGGSINRIITCDSPILTIGDLDGANQYTIEISNWNTSYYPLRIQGIYTVYIEVASNKILSGCNYTIKDRDNITEPSYGIFSNTSNFSFIDYDNEILFFSEQSALSSGLEVSLYLSNTEVPNKQELIGKHPTKQWNYDNYNKTCRVTLQDDLVNLQKTQARKVELTRNVTMYDVFDYLRSKIQYKYYFASLSEEILQYLLNIKLEYYYLEAGTLWKQFDKFCKACGLYMYQDKNNRIVLSFGRE